MSGLQVESERGDDETSHAILYMRRYVATQGKKGNTREIRGKVGTVTWGQRIGPREKVKNRGPRDLRM
jgi:hypothetical protein